MGWKRGLLLSGNIWASRFVVKTENFICKLKAGYSLRADQGCVSA